MAHSTSRIGFGGGCHWCTEAVFQALRGVDLVEQGFIASEAPDDAFSEAVIATFDPSVVKLADLIGAHLATHSSTSNHRMRGKFRSAIYTFDAAQAAEAQCILSWLTRQTGASFVTRVLPFRNFRISEPRFRDYYRTDPERPFCKVSIDPKLAELRARFPALIKDGMRNGMAG